MFYAVLLSKAVLVTLPFNVASLFCSAVVRQAPARMILPLVPFPVSDGGGGANLLELLIKDIRVDEAPYDWRAGHRGGRGGERHSAYCFRDLIRRQGYRSFELAKLIQCGVDLA